MNWTLNVRWAEGNESWAFINAHRLRSLPFSHTWIRARRPSSRSLDEASLALSGAGNSVEAHFLPITHPRFVVITPILKMVFTQVTCDLRSLIPRGLTNAFPSRPSLAPDDPASNGRLALSKTYELHQVLAQEHRGGGIGGNCYNSGR